jgi:hypothetical protein
MYRQTTETENKSLNAKAAIHLAASNAENYSFA